MAEKEFKRESNIGIAFGCLPNMGISLLSMTEKLEEGGIKKIATGIAEIEQKGVTYQVQIHLVSGEENFLDPTAEFGIIE